MTESEGLVPALERLFPAFIPNSEIDERIQEWVVLGCRSWQSFANPQEGDVMFLWWSRGRHAYPDVKYRYNGEAWSRQLVEIPRLKAILEL